MWRLRTIGTGKPSRPTTVSSHDRIPSRRVLKKRQQECGNQNVDMSDVLDGFAHKARDHARVPVQVKDFYDVTIF
jgi:hypothetical protein